MNKNLTIVIPTYNMERYLDKCLTSLIIEDEELMKQLEVLVIIDGAKDRSSEIAHVYQNKYPETFRVIDKENGNYGSCINRGLKEVRGKYIKVLDADDSFDTKEFESYMLFLCNTDVDMVVTDYNIVDKNGNITHVATREMQTDMILQICDELDDFYQYPLQMHAVTYKTEILREHNYVQSEGISYTDQEWMLYPVIWSNTVIYKKYNVYQYLVGREGQTMAGDTSARNVGHHIKRIMKGFEEYKLCKFGDEKRKKYIDNRLARSCAAIYQFYLIKGRNFLPLSELIDFDDKIKMLNNEIYRMLNDFALLNRLRYPFIKQWRKNRNKRVYTAIILFETYSMLSKLKAFMVK